MIVEADINTIENQIPLCPYTAIVQDGGLITKFGSFQLWSSLECSFFAGSDSFYIRKRTMVQTEIMIFQQSEVDFIPKRVIQPL